MIPKPPRVAHVDSSTLLPFNEYDYIIVAFSGGKDSMACVLHLLDKGVPAERIELWHYAIDGRPGEAQFFDWPLTESYCAEFARAFGMRLLFHWKERGFLGEMLRNDQPTAPTTITLGDGATMTVGGQGPKGKRMAYPQVAASLSARWCSAYLKIDVGKKALANDPRFKAAKILICTGERRQESKNRSLYARIERDGSTTLRRRVDQWRPVLDWKEEEVWDIIKRYRVQAHPAYYLGWSRLSCMTCIFGNPDQWASVRAIDPKTFARIHEYEVMFKRNIHRKLSVVELADQGQPTMPLGSEALACLALSQRCPPAYILVPPDQQWVLPSGAYKHSGGPL